MTTCPLVVTPGLIFSILDMSNRAIVEHPVNTAAINTPWNNRSMSVSLTHLFKPSNLNFKFFFIHNSPEFILQDDKRLYNFRVKVRSIPFQNHRLNAIVVKALAIATV